ncbi:hypothetical protein fugu_001455 [Takifugu bimaculatus]|uniref:RING-type domain-containing protein n=1 Tax=Takifugu bimaculatus TaxID=433685 RepID=A0A4Z2CJS2_9TELE|nr:hypothetical protein fugu_001455 [Takifugu bimaculatus]
MSQPDRIENEAELERNGPPANPRAVCNACKRLYRDPRILPCLHTFCSECIGQLEPFSMGGPPRGERPVVTVLCPTCDSEVDIPPSGPGALSTDHLALDEVFLETLVADGPLGCDLCGEGGAESRCEVCCVNLCGFCCQAHRRQKRTASHSVRCLKELKSAGRLSRPVLCSLHPGQELRLFCQPCDRPVCLECAATLHRDHHCSPTRDVVHRHGDRIRELVSGHLRPHLGHLKASLQKVEKSQDALQARVDATASEVRGFARGYARCRGGPLPVSAAPPGGTSRPAQVGRTFVEENETVAEGRRCAFAPLQEPAPPAEGAAAAGTGGRPGRRGLRGEAADLRLGRGDPQRQGRDPETSGQPGRGQPQRPPGRPSPPTTAAASALRPVSRRGRWGASRWWGRLFQRRWRSASAPSKEKVGKRAASFTTSTPLKGLFSSVYICGRTSRSRVGPLRGGQKGCLHAC